MAESQLPPTIDDNISYLHDNISYQVLKEASEELILTLEVEASYTKLATKLAAEELITDKLFDDIILGSLVPSNWDRMQSLLACIYHNMKVAQDPESFIACFMELIDDEAYSGLVQKLECKLKDLRCKNYANPEAVAFKKIRSDVADVLQGNVVLFATRANGKNLISNEQKMAAFPHTTKLIDAVVMGVKRDEEKFYIFLDILHELGGPLIDLSIRLNEELEKRNKEVQQTM